MHRDARHTVIELAVWRQDVDAAFGKARQPPQRRPAEMRDDGEVAGREQRNHQVLAPGWQGADKSVHTSRDQLPFLVREPALDDAPRRTMEERLSSVKDAVLPGRKAANRSVHRCRSD